MWASYGALPSTLVSTRSTVPGTLASAAACTLAATSPVSAVSDLPLTVWGPWASLAVGVAVGEDDEEVAAPAIAAPPAAAPTTAAAVMSLVRRLDIQLMVWGFRVPKI